MTVVTCCPSGLGRHSLLVSKPSLPKRILSHFLSLVDIGSIPVDMLFNSYTMNIEYLFSFVDNGSTTTMRVRSFAKDSD